MPATPLRPLHLAVALDGTGWHPASWREPEARPADLFRAGYWAGLVQEAERGLLDFVTLEDGLGLQSADRFEPDDRTDQVRGRLDAALIAARVAPLTRHIGVVPTVVATHTEPFHVSKSIATLDYVSTGRAGVRVQVSGRRNEAAHFGRRQLPTDFDTLLHELFDEAADWVEAVRRLWDSWEDDAEIRDAATGRFIDREKLHYIDFEGRFFSVRGPRSPRARRRASRWSPRSPTPPSPTAWSAARPTSASPPRTAPSRSPASSPRSARPRSGPDAGRNAARLRRPGGAARRDRAGRTRPAVPSGRPGRRRTHLRRRGVHRDACATGGPAAGVGRRRADRLPVASGRARPRPARRHPRPGARTAGARRLPHRLRGRHPARAARPAAPRQPLRRRLNVRRGSHR
ncbi:LLM class flavin-dependent oxidoreductase [Streptacidiphilus monticola]